MTIENGRKAVFIDRDGTLIEEVNFLSRVEDLRFFPFTLEAVKLLKDNGFLVIVVTNQSGIGRSIYGEDDMHAIHDEIQSHVDGRLDEFYFCPHRPDEGCRCRKPNLGMIEDARRDFGIDFNRSWIVGDKKLDVETGFNAGLGTVMVMTGYGKKHVGELERQPDLVAENLLDAARAIVEKERNEKRKSEKGE
ncbi:MAG TPA: HAD family hydrolase [Pyrinomonadaceae bacterium]|jgi:D-glycero-D-manno-heptose 1,7-bisphosphate phosphatase|nr:HAD family hydrolase [Pyrinomonadaceae bacterium]